MDEYFTDMSISKDINHFIPDDYIKQGYTYTPFEGGSFKLLTACCNLWDYKGVQLNGGGTFRGEGNVSSSRSDTYDKVFKFKGLCIIDGDLETDTFDYVDEDGRKNTSIEIRNIPAEYTTTIYADEDGIVVKDVYLWIADKLQGSCDSNLSGNANNHDTMFIDIWFMMNNVIDTYYHVRFRYYYGMDQEGNSNIYDNYMGADISVCPPGISVEYRNSGHCIVVNDLTLLNKDLTIIMMASFTI